MKSSTPLIETPRSISIVTREQIKTQAPKNIEQALSYTAGVVTETSGAQDSRMSGGATIRGFSNGSAYYKDGLLQPAVGTYASWDDAIDTIESIEILKGPASVLYGHSRPGGIVNVNTKRPTADHVNSVGLQLGSYNRRQLSADVGSALDEDQRVLFRLAATGRDGETRLDHSRDDLLSVAPSLLWNISAATKLTLLGNYSRERGTPKAWWPNAYTFPQSAGLPTSRNAGEPSFERFDRDIRSFGYSFEHATDSGWNFTQNLRYAEIDIDYRHVYAYNLLADGRTANRGSLAQQTEANNLAVDSRLARDFSWGGVSHAFSLGLDYLKYRQRGAVGFGTAPDLDIYAPVYGYEIPLPALNPTRSTLAQTGIYTTNQFKWNRWVANASLRYDVARSTRESTTQPKTRDSATTGSLGLLYLFDNGIAPYASYATSFNPITGLKFDGSAFEPTEGTQYEAGVKYQPPGQEGFVTVSLFDLTQTNTTTTDLAHPGFSVQTGEERSTGIELEGYIVLMRDLGIKGAYTYQNPRVTRSNVANRVGCQSNQVPKETASIWLDYRPAALAGWQFAGGARYKGKTPAGFGCSAPYDKAFTLADLAIAYETTEYRIALNVTNVFDKKYFTNAFRGSERETSVQFNYYW
ncbi:TonB-dependent siderophore receptor [Pseudothauera nasutitermitis]|uniref:TonB-dependent siderophore receptor n=1 Tax=Pseudothauera nasutitermitis TaxID=2565930 RepID=UPI001B3B2AC8|nr:TonB-dependent siderophore receptor [Pseudothauera nasutitermitis]